MSCQKIIAKKVTACSLRVIGNAQIEGKLIDPLDRRSSDHRDPKDPKDHQDPKAQLVHRERQAAEVFLQTLFM